MASVIGSLCFLIQHHLLQVVKIEVKVAKESECFIWRYFIHKYKTKTVLLRKATEVERIGKNERHIWLWLNYLNVYTKGKNILCYWVLYSCESVPSYPPTYQKLSENKHTPLSDYHTCKHISLVLVEYLPVVSQFNPEAWKVIRRNPMYSSLQAFPSVAFMLHSFEDHI